MFTYLPIIVCCHTFHWEPTSCTTVMLARDGHVVLGDNEDAGTGHPLSDDPSSATVWIFPVGSELGGEFGCLWVGWPHANRVSGQAGMNGAGLALGLTAVPSVKMMRHPGRPYNPKNDGGLYYRILLHCATVEEAIGTSLSYDLDSLWNQILVADDTGNAAIIAPSDDGGISVVRRPFGTSFLVASTINVSTGDAVGARDAKRRFTEASQVLNADESPATTAVWHALEATHRARPLMFGSYTMYSSLFDLTGRTVQLCFLSGFPHIAILDLEEELDAAPSAYRFVDLIPASTSASALSSYRSTQRLGKVLTGVGVLGAGCIAAVVGPRLPRSAVGAPRCSGWRVSPRANRSAIGSECRLGK